MLADAVALDQSAAYIMDAKLALRDVLQGIGVPQKWVRTEGQVAEIETKQSEQADQQQMLSAMEQGAGVAKDLAAAGMVGQPA